ncbi:uncharacterized protein LOC127290454 isoform X2 [Leptopilina boulardi]|uniref:uncharacterized protein LOC127290454 isoform X2 n=1 Tax=Leptopilina boulardi TaxID=63433 RepID=UPI0021F668FD|nr:uncharacterized protein LOC127290454 isoform X2 [Leptopilina boulardi]
MATTRSLGFYFAIITILSIFVDTNCQTPPSENSSSKDACFSSNTEVDVEMEPFHSYTLKWNKPNFSGLIEYQICMSEKDTGVCEFYKSSAVCPTFTMKGYMPKDLFHFVIYAHELSNLDIKWTSSEFNTTEIIDGCKPRGDIKVLNITKTSAILQWEKPKNCKYMDSIYFVEKNRQLRNGWNTLEGYHRISIASNTTNVTVKDLEPGKKYVFTLDVALLPNRIKGISSPEIRIKHPLDSKIDSYVSKKLEKINSDVPFNPLDYNYSITVVDFDDTTAYIQWGKPENISTAAKMEVFIIDLNNTREPELLDYVYPDELYNFVKIKYLKPDTGYKFLVAYTDGEDVHFLISEQIITAHPNNLLLLTY